MDKILKKENFIKANRENHTGYTGENLSPMFRKKFSVTKEADAVLYIHSPGYAYCYINGKLITEDKFVSAVSDYEKTLWVHKYDVTELINEGENIICVWCGNGWYNEEFPSAWDYDKAVWRDIPKFVLTLDIGQDTKIVSDDSWRCKPECAIYFNALRSGEYFDSRKYDSNWTSIDYDDSDWEYAVKDDIPPKGKFRLCECEPIREFEEYETREIYKSGQNKYVFDIGQNISGYIRLYVKGNSGDVLTIRYAEEINDDFSLKLNEMDEFYFSSPFQTDKFICDGNEHIWSPRFCYHGFRFIEIDGITDIESTKVSGVFVHQAVERRTELETSDEFINKLFKMGVYSVYSNMFYSITDCPTREKLGWANDAQASMESLLTNFKSENVLEKWLYDMYDAMRDDGAMPGIIPTSGWGFQWGNGPVSDGVLFELPYRLYLHTGNSEPLKKSLEYFDRYFNYIATRTDEDGFIRFGLVDWARPGCEIRGYENDVPLEFINSLLLCEFCRIAALSADLCGKDNDKYLNMADKYKELVMSSYLDPSGRCTVHKQTSVAMLIYYDAYTSLEPLKEQLIEIVEEFNFNHDCGMVGLRRLYYALNKCGLEEYAYKIITAGGNPSYREWMENGATTLWESWDWKCCKSSRNHQMYSDVMSWMIKTILGINMTEPGLKKISIAPYYFSELSWAKGSYMTQCGEIKVSWHREEEYIVTEIDVPTGVEVEYRDKVLDAGNNIIREKISLVR